MKPFKVKVKVAYDAGARFTQKTAVGYHTGFDCQILNRFLMEDGSWRGIEDMTDDEILDALALAGAVGKELEKKGFRVAY